MTPYYETDNGKLYNGDCLDIMREMDSDSVDLVLTDPPYNCGKDYDVYKDNLPEDVFWNWYEMVFSDIFRLMKTGMLYLTCTTMQKYKIKPLLEKIGFDHMQDMVWFHPNLCGGTKIIKMPWSIMHEPIMLFKKNKRQKMKNEIREFNTFDVFIYPSPQSQCNKYRRLHITQKPLALYSHILTRNPSNVMLDPFLGSGTTAVACEQLDRRWIGIELSQDYCNIAVKRIEKEAVQGKLALS